MAIRPSATPIPDRVLLRRALFSVFDKSGIADFAKALAARDVDIISTGGTRAALTAAGLSSRDISEVTGFPEIMGGRVKTLHPLLHGALLGVRDDPEHAEAMTKHQIGAIDLLVCNLYPFEETAASGADERTIVENIDIGGPAMIRAAAKNHAYVTVVVDPADYTDILAALDANDRATPLALRRHLAAKAFARTGAYDSAVAGWFAGAVHERFPKWATFGGPLLAELRYGENPHQSAALYKTGEHRAGAASARQVQGKELSYNNLNDTDAAFELVAEFAPETAAVAIIKHTNPCGVAVAPTLAEAYRRAFVTDTFSAFGGVVALNLPIDEVVAAEIAKIFTEVVIAPGASDAALAILAGKKNLRVLLTDTLPDPRAQSTTIRSVAGGLLVQDRDSGMVSEAELTVVTRRTPSEAEVRDMLFAWRVAKHVKSNAIVYARDGATTGIGAGQMSRLDSAMVAARKGEGAAREAGLPRSMAFGSVCASDAFFPFPDGLLAAADAGITAVIQPGGSQNDPAVIAAANERGLAMVVTGMRHFRH